MLKFSKISNLVLILLVLPIAAGCAVATPVPTPTPVPPTSTPVPPTATLPPPTPMSIMDAYQYVEIGTVKGSSPEEGIASLALNPAGTILAYGTYTDNSVHLVDVASTKEVGVLEGHTAAVSGLAFSPNGELLASTGTTGLPPNKDGSVRIWNVATREQVAVFNTSGVSQLSFSPDGTLLAAAAGGNPVQIILWDVTAHTQKNTLKNVFLTASFSPDGKLLGTSKRDNLVHVMDVATGQEVMPLSGHEGWVWSTAFAPNGKILASGSDDATIIIWDAETGEKIKTLTGHESEVSFLLFNGDGTILASVANGQTIKREGTQFTISLGPADPFIQLWDVSTGEPIGRIETKTEVATVSFSSDWSVIATSDSTGVIHLWSREK